jgi:hypothetical protein
MSLGYVTEVTLHCDDSRRGHYRVESKPTMAMHSRDDILDGLTAGAIAECLDSGYHPQSWAEAMTHAKHAAADDEALDLLVTAELCDQSAIDESVRRMTAALPALLSTWGIESMQHSMSRMSESDVALWERDDDDAQEAA